MFLYGTGALTHTSVGLRDALLGVSIPFIEIHISNPHSREAFRHHSYLSDKAIAIIAGLGVTGYGEFSLRSQNALRYKRLTPLGVQRIWH